MFVLSFDVDLLGWGIVFGLLVDYFGLHVVAVATGAVVYKIPVSNLRRQDRTYTRFHCLHTQISVTNLLRCNGGKTFKYS